MTSSIDPVRGFEAYYYGLAFRIFQLSEGVEYKCMHHCLQDDFCIELRTDLRNLGTLTHLFRDKTPSMLGYFGAGKESMKAWSRGPLMYGIQMYPAAGRNLPGRIRKMHWEAVQRNSSHLTVAPNSVPLFDNLELRAVLQRPCDLVGSWALEVETGFRLFGVFCHAKRVQHH